MPSDLDWKAVSQNLASLVHFLWKKETQDCYFIHHEN